MEWLDAHTHLDTEELYPSLQKVLERAEKAGVTKILAVNSEANEQSFRKTLSCVGNPSLIQIVTSLGVHPHEASLYNSGLEKTLVELLASPGVIALGEIGLDFYYNYSPPDAQESTLLRQLQLARHLDLPVVIHCRDAYGVLANLLKKEGDHWRGMIHCFTGTPAEADNLLALGFFISFSGILTFPKAEVLRDAARIVPLDRMLIETDAPYLAPVPHRGKTNEPSFVVHTGMFLSNLKQTEPEAFTRQLHLNFLQLFSIPDRGISLTENG